MLKRTPTILECWSIGKPSTSSSSGTQQGFRRLGREGESGLTARSAGAPPAGALADPPTIGNGD